MKCMERRTLVSVFTSVMFIATFGAVLAAQTVREVTASRESRKLYQLNDPYRFRQGLGTMSN
jgi:hypothetical protein